MEPRSFIEPLRWPRVTQGHEIAEVAGEAWLVEREPLDQVQREDVWPTREDPLLFANAAELVTQPDEALRAFADAHGLLGLTPERVTLRGTRHMGERPSEWRLRLEPLREAWNLARGLREDDPATLRSLLLQGRNPLVAADLRDGKLSDPRAAAAAQLEHIANQNLGKLPCLSFRLEGELLHFGVAPPSLLAALWLQLGEWWEGQPLFRQCVTCGKWLAIPSRGRGRRAALRYCSNACRQRDYRVQQEEARRRYASGESVDEIAKTLGKKTTETVERWVGLKPGTGRKK